MRMEKNDDEKHVSENQNQRESEFWLNELAGELSKSTFPVDIISGGGEKYHSDIVKAKFPDELFASLMKLRNESDSRLFMILTAGVVIQLSKYSGNTDVIIGAPIFKQDVEAEFINTILTLRNRLEYNMTFKELLLKVRQTIVAAEKNQNFPIDALLRKLGMSMSENDFPLFDVMVLLENVHDRSYIKRINPAIIFSFSREDNFIEVNLEFNALRYERSTGERILHHFICIMQKAMEDISVPLSHIEMFAEEEKNRLLYDFNSTSEEYEIDITIQELFEQQVEKTPGNTAVVFNGKSMTYGELNGQANQLAGFLRKKSINRESIVGIMMDPSLDMVVGILGILKAGGAYLPIDPTMPTERATSMLTDCGVQLILTKAGLIDPYSYTSLQGLNEKQLKTHHNELRKQIIDLDSLPIPNRSLVNYEKYNRYIGQVMVTDVISLQTARGCPYRCSYCSKVWHKIHKFRSAENIFDELMIYYNMGIRRFSIFDDIFNINIENGMKFFKLIIENDLNIQLFFPNGMRGDLLTKEYIDLAVEAGLVATALALETASPRLQKLIKKNLNLEKFRENVEYFCEKYPQVILELFTIHGFPTETEEEAKMTLDFITSLKWVHFPYINILKIYPDTEMEALALENGVHREAILKCEELALHETSPTSPFKESFTKKYQSDFLNEYFLSKERLLQVLPYQLKVLTKDEIIQKYDSYLPTDIKTFQDLLQLAGITENELEFNGFLGDETFIVPDFNQKLKKHFHVTPPTKNALRVLALDLSQFFSTDTQMLYDVVEAPLGLLYLMTYLNQQLGERVDGRIAKSRIDFDNFEELKKLLDDFKPDVIAVRTLTFYKNFFHTTVEVLREYGYDGPIIAGGPYASRNADSILQDRNVDVVALLEGEYTFCDIIEKIIENNGKLPDDEGLKEIPGIAFVPKQNVIHENFAREIVMADHLSLKLKHESSENPEIVNQSSNLAYVIFTSGSTGKPKGVLVEHRNVVNLLHWFGKSYNLNSGSRVMQLTNLMFDPSVEQIFGSLIHGASIYIGDKQLIANNEGFINFLEDNKINVLNFVPETLRELLGSKKKPEYLDILISGGEKLDETVKTELIANGYQLYNHYGPTEITVDALTGRCLSEKPVTLGKPISNVQCYILGKDGNLSPIGVAGELYISGAGVARGYLNRPQITDDNFVEDPFSKVAGQRMYKTGDIARWLTNGEIEFRGRSDHQVKIRGHRVELGEIESQLKNLPGIRDAAVTEVEDKGGFKYLCAYYLCDEKKETELLPSVGDYLLWDDLLYYAMANDRLKNNAYKIAIERNVKGKTVVEVGTGKDMILARMAVEAGAKKVYAIEIQEEYYLKAKDKLVELGLDDKIELILGDSRNVELPEKVDVNLSNQIGSIGSSEGAIVLHNDARRFLTENSLVIPHRCVTMIAAVTLPDKLRQKPFFSKVSKDYAEKIYEKFDAPFDVRLCIQHLPKSNIISDADIFEDLYFQEMMDDDCTQKIKLSIDKNGKLDGFILWIHFYTVPDHLVDTIAREHIWKPVYMPAFSPALDVGEGDLIEADCIRSLGENNLSPDYKIEGTLVKTDGRRIAFCYSMPYVETTYKGTPFFRDLHENESLVQSEEVATTLSEYDLRQYLEKKLPEYMIPAYFVPLKEFPTTSSGKLDRQGLADPAMMGAEIDAQYVAPRTPIEEKIADIWQSVLGRKEIGINENFFMIGGDSIKAIQILSRMNNEGLHIKMSDVFQNPFIADLAPIVSVKETIADQSAVSGDVPLTPVQERFFEEPPVDSHHYNQSMMLKLSDGLDEAAIKKIFRKIIEHHDALRMVYKTNDNGTVTQTILGADLPIDLQVFDMKHVTDREEASRAVIEKANTIQTSIDLENGPLMKLGLYHMYDGNFLQVVVHHLAVDGISWRILFEDIDTLIKQFEEGKALVLPLKTDSFKLWADKLVEYADSDSFLEEIEWWKKIENQNVVPIEPEIDGSIVKADSIADSFQLTPEESHLLLTNVNHAFGTEINDILLTALGLAAFDTWGHPLTLIALEGHGREEIMEDVDINRTIGWFTSIYPVLLDCRYNNDLARQIMETKENLRRLPNKGIGYGILKYLTSPEKKAGISFNLEPQIAFNYLGQFDSDVGERSFSVGGYSAGASQSRNALREHEIDINGLVAGGRLRMSVSCGKQRFKAETLKRFVDSYKNRLSEIIAFCASREERVFTPGDFTFRDLSIENFLHLTERVDGHIEDIYPLTPMQEGMLFHALYDPDSSAYFEQVSYRIHGELDLKKIQESIRQLFQRYDVLRTLFIHEGPGLSRPVQVVVSDVPMMEAFVYEDVRESLANGDMDEFCRQYLEKDRHNVFRMDTVPLMRVTLLQLADDVIEFIWSHHHILMDGWCTAIIVGEFFEIYNSLLTDRSPRLSEVTPFRTYIQWLEKQDKKQLGEFWSRYLEDCRQVSSIMPPASANFKGEYKAGTTALFLDEENTAALNRIAVDKHVTMNTLCQSVWSLLLSRYSGESTVIFGSVVSGRPSQLSGIEKMVGLFVNTIPVRISIDPQLTFKELIKIVQQDALECEPHHYYPLAQIQSHSPLKQNLFDHIMSFQNFPITEQIKDSTRSQEREKDAPSLSVSNVSGFGQTNYDFSLLITTGKRIAVKIDYNENLCDREYANAIARRFEYLLCQAAQQEELPLGQFTFVTPDEKKQILEDFNNTARKYPNDKTLHQLFAEQADKTPGSIAVSSMDYVDELTQSITLEKKEIFTTYRELNQRSIELAHRIMKNGAVTGDIVAIISTRTINMVIGILAILKAGCAYLPIDPDLPTDRIRYMISDSNATLVVVSDEISQLADSYPNVIINPPIDNNNTQESLTGIDNALVHGNKTQPDDLAYVIYTSGTTGRPKGVVIKHSSAVNIVTWSARLYGVSTGVNVLQMSSYTFDASVNQIFSTLLYGGSLHVVPKAWITDFDALWHYIETHCIRMIHYVPVLLGQLLIGRIKPRSLEVIISGADKLEENVKNDILSNGYTLYNQYGPTETTVDALVSLCSIEKPVSLGHPVDNAACYILDKHDSLMPIGIVGQLCIAGTGVAPGYLNRPELTAEKFISVILNKDDPESKTRVYKTGDLVRRLPDGSIEFLGRIDHQVKIRGFRIEMGEIETCLIYHENVKDAVVIDEIDNNYQRTLCAYIVPTQSESSDKVSAVSMSSVSMYREFLGQYLPDYMIPSRFVNVEAIPLTAVGKVDRKALSSMGTAVAVGVDYVQPSGKMETVLVDIWQEVLGVEKVGVHDNFFDLGGDSLKAIQLVAKIRRDLQISIPLPQLFSSPNVKSLALFAQEQSTHVEIEIEKAEEKDFYMLSHVQKRMFFLYQMEPDNINYNMPTTIPLDIDYDEKKIVDVINRLIQRHESFRTSFHMMGDTPVQCIHSEARVEVEYYDPCSNYDEFINTRRKFIRPFDLSRPPAIRVGVLKMDESVGCSFLFLDMHHIITDGASLSIIRNEFTQLFHGGELPPLKLQYRDYSEWLNSRIQQDAILSQEQYWLDQFPGEIPLLDLPLDFPRPVVQKFNGAELSFYMGGTQLRGLRSIAGDTDATLFMTLLAVFNVLLARLSGQEDIVVGTPIIGRRHADLENIVGLFINTLPLRNFPSDDKTFVQFLMELKERSVNAFENQEYPFEDIVEKVAVKRDLSRNPLFDVLFSLQNRTKGEAAAEVDTTDTPESSSFEDHSREGYREVTNFDLTLNCFEGDNAMVFSFEYATSLFKKDSINRFGTYFRRIITAVVENPKINIGKLDLMTVEEKERLLYTFNDTQVDYPSLKTLHQLFREQAEKTPNLTAVTVAGQTKLEGLTYKELDSEAQQIALYLKSQGVRPGSIVGLMTRRSRHMVTGILGVLKTGAAYIPVDPEFPVERIRYIIETAGTQWFLTAGSGGEKLREIEYSGKHLELTDPDIYSGDIGNDDEERTGSPTDLAYIIYTSGSTGNPKGVMIEHRNAVNFITGMTHLIDFPEGKRILALTTISFDIFFLETLLPLTIGMEVVIAADEIQKESHLLEKLLVDSNIDMVQATPSRMKMFLTSDETLKSFENVSQLMVGGEAFPLSLLLELRSNYNGRIYNMYGPTETTIWSAVKELTDCDTVTIGKPIANTNMYIVNRFGNLQPVGIPGELCIGGDGVGRGYHNNSALTIEKFLPLSSLLNGDIYTDKDDRVYRTGDLARWLENGDIECLGRVDQQVKVRGFRIELEEIEECLYSHHSISEAVVTAHADSTGDNFLCAYIVAEEEFDADDIRSFLSKKLPDYMIPAYFTHIDEIPLTANGKIDRRALPEPDIMVGTEYVAPENETEEKLVAIWADVLNLEPSSIGVNTNFFEIGGNSLNLLKVRNQISITFELDISMSNLFLYQTVRTLASNIFKENILNKLECIVKLNEAPTKKNLFIIHPRHGLIYQYKEFAKLVSDKFNVYGIQARGLEKDSKLPETHEWMVADYLQQLLTVQPEGPYYIIGFCYGIYIGYNMVKLLELMNKEVKIFMMLDDGPFVWPAFRRYYRNREILFSVKRAFKSLFGLRKTTDEHIAIKRYNMLVEQIQKKDEENAKLPPLSAEDIPQQKAKIRVMIDKMSNKYLQSGRGDYVNRMLGIIKAPVVAISAQDSHFEEMTPKTIKLMTYNKWSIDSTPGGHDTMFESPYVETLAEKILEYIKMYE